MMYLIDRCGVCLRSFRTEPFASYKRLIILLPNISLSFYDIGCGCYSILNSPSDLCSHEYLVTVWEAYRGCLAHDD